MFTVLITGPPGVGKTSVLTALVDSLTDDDVPHAAIELETLVESHAPARRAAQPCFGHAYPLRAERRAPA